MQLATAPAPIASAPLVIEDEALVRLYAYWDGKRAGRRFPARADIHPLDFAYLLGWVMLIDVAYQPLSFRFRLYGSELAGNMNFDLTGKDLAEHPDPEFRTRTARVWAEVVDGGQPTCSKYDGWVDGRLMRYEALRLPLSSDGETIDMLLVAVHHLTIAAEAPAFVRR